MREWLRSQCCKLSVQFSSVQSLSCVWLFVTPWTQHPRPSPSITISRSLLKLMSISQWCHPTISSSVGPFSSCLYSSPTSGSFPMSQFLSKENRLSWLHLENEGNSILHSQWTLDYTPACTFSELWTMFLVAMGITYQPNWPPRLIKTRFYPKISHCQKECDHPLCSQSPLNSLWHPLV